MTDFSSSSDRKPISASKDRFRLLLVDNEADIVRDLKRGLEIEGFEVDAFNSAQEAMNSFKPNLYDLAILDIRMPGLNGFALNRKMKEIDPSLATCFLSAFEIHPYEFKKVLPSMANGVKTIIKKPISIQVLVKEISSFLRMSAIIKTEYSDHIFAVFGTKREIIDTALEFPRLGLIENNEDIIFGTNQITKEKIRRLMATEWHVDAEQLEAEGRINLFTFEEWHFKDGIFDIQRDKDSFVGIFERSRKRGAKGVHVLLAT